MIEILDELDTPQSREIGALLEEVAREDLRNQTGGTDYEVSITLTDGACIREINREQRGVDSETDVLSFPLWDKRGGEEPFRDPETGNILLGDIVISLPRAQEQAEEYGHSLRREASYLCTHGILHLLGFDHMQEDEKKEMREREEALLALLHLTRED